MKDTEVTKFLVSFSGHIEYVRFPGGVFDDYVYVQYEVVWGPDWEPVSGLSAATSQQARSGEDPETVLINMPLDMVFTSTNVSGWPQLVLTVRGVGGVSGDSVRGYGVVLLPTVAGGRRALSALRRPQPATALARAFAALTGRYPELVEPKMLATGKDNYLLRTESYGSVCVQLGMVSQDLRALGYDNTTHNPL